MTPEPEPDTPRPPVWQWLTAIGLVVASVAAGITSEMIADQFGGERGWLNWLIVCLAVGGAVAVAYLGNRAGFGPARSGPHPDEPPARLGRPPEPPADFIGEQEDLAAVVAMLAGSRVVAVVGHRGLGTSTFVCAAVTWLYRDDGARRFPRRGAAAADRRRLGTAEPVYLDLRPGGRALSSEQVLARLLGEAPAPRFRHRRHQLVELADRVRQKFADSGALVVLDNIDRVAQVAPLLPWQGGSSRVLLAGTPALRRANGVVAHEIDSLSTAQAARLFAAAAGADQPADADRGDGGASSGGTSGGGTSSGGQSGGGQSGGRAGDVAAAIGRICRGLPRTLRVLGYLTARNGGWDAEELLQALERVRDLAPYQSLAAREERALALVADLDLAYRGLSAPARRAYQMLSLATGPLEREAVAAAGGMRAARTYRALAELEAAGLVQHADGGRVRPCAHLSVYPRLQLHLGLSRRRRTTAYARLLRWHARQAEQYAAQLGNAGGGTTTGPAAGDLATRFPRTVAMLHELVMRDALAPLPRGVRRWWFRLAVALGVSYATSDQLDPWKDLCDRVLELPEAPAVVTAWARNGLGVVLRRQGRLDDAETQLRLAAGVRGRGRGDTVQARLNLGLVLIARGHGSEAVNQLELARRLVRRRDRLGHALVDLALGAAHLVPSPAAPAAALTAQQQLVRAVDGFREAIDGRGYSAARRGYAAALNNLGVAQWRLGHQGEARDSWQTALRIFTEINHADGAAAARRNHQRAAHLGDPETP